MDGALFPHKPPTQFNLGELHHLNLLINMSNSAPLQFTCLLFLLLLFLSIRSSTPRHANSAARFPSLEVSTESTQKWRHEVKSVKPVLGIEIGSEDGNFSDGSLKLLRKKEVVLLNAIVEQPLTVLSSFFDSAKSELLRTDLFILVKALDGSGQWEKAVLLFEWLILSFNYGALKIHHQVIEILVRILGRKSQYSVAAEMNGGGDG